MTYKLRDIFLLIAVASAVALGMSSCGSSKKKAYSNVPAASGVVVPSVPKRLVLDDGMSSPTRALLAEADSWIGTRYRYGGNDRTGVDCSGFVTQVYNRALNIKLPRTSAQQKSYCRSVGKGALEVGDLLFFTVKGGKSIGHVGIYVGNGNMIHASSSKGVVITPLSSPYFASNYSGAGRVDSYYAMVSADRKKKKSGHKAEPQSPLSPSPSSGTFMASVSEAVSPAARLRANSIEASPASAPALAASVNSASDTSDLQERSDVEENVTIIEDFFD